MTIALESIIDTYGYFAVTIGTFFEGETILVIAGFAAHQGYMKLPGVIIAAFIGTVMGDQLFFFLGRHYSDFFLSKFGHLKPRIEKVHRLIERYQIIFILGFRFVYGIRTISPFAIGMSKVPALLYVVLNIISALVWATLIATGGFMFGKLMSAIIKNVEHYEAEIIGLVAVIGGIIWLIHLHRKNK